MIAAPSFQYAESRCPQCRYKLDGSTLIEGGNPALPKPGDASLCINCGQVLTYETDCHLRKATTTDIGELMRGNPEGWAVIEKAQLFIRRRGRFA